MARANKRSPRVEELRPYLDGVAKNLVERLYGPQGPAWGTRLTEIEDAFLEIRDVLTESLLDRSLAQQAATLAEQTAACRTCPGCQTPLACDQANPRLLRTRAGEATWPEPEGYCPRCRRAFFPSVEEPGP
jgi:NADH pyrophosphatase NudC (nudix superfamily)